jgi:hypothetical protein
LTNINEQDIAKEGGATLAGAIIMALVIFFNCRKGRKYNRNSYDKREEGRVYGEDPI